ncbi:MAG: NAD(P)H-dependent oxidoreductase [Deltaproteobacteria bacterium]|nr:NAD(P)H-dependent oxidoreductase [Deltaproteobacteria bacterium]
MPACIQTDTPVFSATEMYSSGTETGQKARADLRQTGPPRGQGEPLVLVCSPRTGNSALAGRTFADACAEAGCAVKLLFLRDYQVLPCVDCGVCADARTEFSECASWRLCPLSLEDNSAALFQALLTARFVAICAPVYFYHLPAQLKALLDRCQLWYQTGLRKKSFMLKQAQRDLYTILLGARAQGKELFRGSLLSLKYALRPLRLEQRETVLLRGIDRIGDLSARPDFLERLRACARTACNASAISPVGGK